MSEPPRDLVKRTFEFAVNVRQFVNRLPKSMSNYEDARQLVRSSGSVAANYIEAQEGLSRKDFFYRIKVCRKEVRETGLWLRLIDCSTDESLHVNREGLVCESDELTRIFSSIAGKEN
jgi:four helix bundle protein